MNNRVSDESLVNEASLISKIDPSVLEDPILLLKWLEETIPVSECTIPSDDKSLEVEGSFCSSVVKSGRQHDAKPPHDSLESIHIEVAQGVSTAEEYLSWLEASTSSEHRIALLNAYKYIEECSFKYKLITKPLLNISDVSAIRSLQTLLFQKKEFRSMDATKRYTCGLALRQFAQFLSK